MNDNTTQLLEGLAAKLGTTAQYLWSVLVRGNRITGFFDLFLSVVGLGIIFIGYKLIRYSYSNESGYDDEGYLVGGIAVTVIGLIMFSVFGYYGFVLSVTPEYGAITDILGALKK